MNALKYRERLFYKKFSMILFISFLFLIVLYHCSDNITNIGKRDLWPKNWEERITISNRVNSLPGTTGTGIPGIFQKWIQSASGIEIDEDALNYYGSEKAIAHVENIICGGWNAEKSNFNNEKCMEYLHFNNNQEYVPKLDPSEVDIVVPSIRDLDFLNEWKEFFQGFHVIIIQDGDQSKHLNVPSWVDYELHKRVDIERVLGKNQWIISDKDASIRNYGFLLSKKRYIYTIDDDCLPAYDENGYKINPLAYHIRNLKTPSIPYMFNTLYDPYVNGSDFVRGYPYSLRNGVRTVVSHGLWVNAPDYDAPTQLLKVTERQNRMFDVALTVPYGIMFPLCSMNVAFDRKLLGPAMMQGLMGTGHPWGRYDDMFSGWASKVVADHLGYGVKSGMPYIRHNKASNPFTNLKKEYKGLWWQEHALRFFTHQVKFSEDIKTPEECYRSLANQIRKYLGTLHPYFHNLANAMELWTDYWEKANKGQLDFTPSRSRVRSYLPINLGLKSKESTMITQKTTTAPEIKCDENTVSGSHLLPPFENPPICDSDMITDNGCTWAECYENTNNDKKKLVFLISGQITRLELQSKITNLFDVNKDEFEIILLFLLKQGTSLATNIKTRADSPISTTEWCNTSAIEEWIRNTLFVDDDVGDIVLRQERNNQLKPTLVTRKNFYTVVRDKTTNDIKYKVNVAITHGEFDGEVLENHRWVNPLGKREVNFFSFAQDSFRNMRKNMIMLEDIELKMKTPVDIVFRLREDTLVHLPYYINKDKINTNTFVTPNCWGSGGYNDVNYIMGRGIASKVMRGMAEDYYFRINKHYGNPETHLREIVRYLTSDIIVEHFCDWPMMPVVWKLKDDGTYKLEARPMTTILTEGCLRDKTVKHRKFCAWRSSDIPSLVVSQKQLDSPHLQAWVP